MVRKNLARVVVVIPTYDEKENIAPLIDEVLAQQKLLTTLDLHIVVADSSSKDGTDEIVVDIAKNNPKVHLLTIPQRGIGLGLYSGIKYGIDKLNGDFLVQIDADFQHNPSDIPQLLAPLTEGYDLVVGSRFIKGSINNMPWYRKVLSFSANQLICIILGLKNIKEITTSYRAFTKDLFLKIPENSVPWKEESFIAVPVLLIRMLEHCNKVVEVPITMHIRTRGYSKMFYFRYLRDIVIFSIKSKLQY